MACRRRSSALQAIFTPGGVEQGEVERRRRRRSLFGIYTRAKSVIRILGQPRPPRHRRPAVCMRAEREQVLIDKMTVHLSFVCVCIPPPMLYPYMSPHLVFLSSPPSASPPPLSFQRPPPAKPRHASTTRCTRPSGIFMYAHTLPSARRAGGEQGASSVAARSERILSTL